MRKKGRKIKYKANSDVTLRLLAGLADFTEAEILKMSLPIRTCLQKFVIGTADEADWNTLAHVANVVVLCGEKIAEEVKECGKEAQKSVLRILHNFKVQNVWSISDDDMAAMAAAVDVHEQLLRLCKPRDILWAVDESHRRSMNGKVVILVEDVDAQGT